MDIINSPYPYFGSKTDACRIAYLHLYLPKFTSKDQIYVEPFFGGGAVFWNANGIKSAIINDVDDSIWNFMTVLKNNKKELEKELEYVWNGKKWFEEYEKRTDPIGKAVFFYIQAKNAPMGIIKKNFQKSYFANRFVKDFTKWKIKLDNLISLSITNDDFRDVYQRISDKGGPRYNFIIYNDPPYYDPNGNNNTNNYRNNFTETDHKELAKYNNLIKNSPHHHIFISYNDDEEIKKMYCGWHIKKIGGRAKASKQKIKDYSELLISNRPIILRDENGKRQSNLNSMIQGK